MDNNRKCRVTGPATQGINAKLILAAGLWTLAAGRWPLASGRWG